MSEVAATPSISGQSGALFGHRLVPGTCGVENVVALAGRHCVVVQCPFCGIRLRAPIQSLDVNQRKQYASLLDAAASVGAAPGAAHAGVSAGAAPGAQPSTLPDGNHGETLNVVQA